MEDGKEEEVMSISEYMEGMEAQQLEADLVLGGDEGNECTYEKGYMKRQAVFSCLTCTPQGDAGFCTACSLVCHDGHEVVELWTRRGFRCDCGNVKFGESVECKLFKEKDSENKANVYNQNYRGLYCSCHRPFPDPEKTEQAEMLQCCICEDWFHEDHLGLPPSYQVPRDDEGEPSFDELVCPSCVGQCSFLSQYQDLLVPLECVEEDPPATASNTVEQPSPSVVVSKDHSEVHLPEPSLNVPSGSSRDSSEAAGSNRDLGKSTPEEILAKGKSATSGKCNAELTVGESSNGGVLSCKLKEAFQSAAAQLETGKEFTSEDVGVMEEGKQSNGGGQAIFLAKSWRAELCRCDSCLAMYREKGLCFLLDSEDTIQEYEEIAKLKREESQVKQAGMAWDFMNKLGHVQKMELIHGVTDMATELGTFLTTFRQTDTTVTSADIYEFFDKLQQKRRRLN
ncbi:unnamed protein product [Calypogeia fissa]